ncbi:hypothetical protein [Actibacterium ureilyticum]|uniref:hypothetical protein n=1 Tax=Actibacterium ureilyticum TaxID=1590614 RepID=UPI000BAAB402|nr:hypothetical protein [Actibacterium ureilyticum]
MSGRRIHILGASGSGTSSLARGLAGALGSQMFDCDDFYWLPTDPPFQDKRPIDEREALMQALFLPRADWVLSGSFTSWGRLIKPRLTHVIFLSVPAGMRLARLRRRERRRYGARIDPGGDLAAQYRTFLDWAMSYDDRGFTGRSRHVHESWLAEQEVPVIRLDASLQPAQVLDQAIAALDPATAEA